MNRCKIIIQDEVNVKIDGLDVEIRRKIANKLKWAVPYARYLPQYKLGRWDGKVGFFGLGGNGYVNHLDVIIQLLNDYGIEIEESQNLTPMIGSTISIEASSCSRFFAS